MVDRFEVTENVDGSDEKNIVAVSNIQENIYLAAECHSPALQPQVDRNGERW
jgi:hypothetical protein